MASLAVVLKVPADVWAYVAMKKALKFIVEEGEQPWGGLSVEAEVARRVLAEVDRLEAKS